MHTLREISTSYQGDSPSAFFQMAFSFSRNLALPREFASVWLKSSPMSPERRNPGNIPGCGVLLFIRVSDASSINESEDTPVCVCALCESSEAVAFEQQQQRQQQQLPISARHK